MKRAMIAARLANLAQGSNQHSQKKEGGPIGPSSKDQEPVSTAKAAKMLNVSERTVKHARETIVIAAAAILIASQAHAFNGYSTGSYNSAPAQPQAQPFNGYSSGTFNMNPIAPTQPRAEIYNGEGQSLGTIAPRPAIGVAPGAPTTFDGTQVLGTYASPDALTPNTANDDAPTSISPFAPNDPLGNGDLSNVDALTGATRP